MADDLRYFLSQQPARLKDPEPAVLTKSPATVDSTKVRADSDTARGDSQSRPIRIVPKGLRSFDEHDADFFLELLPGPRDRDGLPDSIRFWKTRCEESDPGKTFSVGLIYGPSGCGKSSLMKAGLIPRVASHVTAVYVEATADETESRLLHRLRRQVPSLSSGLGLKESLSALRRGEALATGH
jgi:hypothetical protein